MTVHGWRGFWRAEFMKEVTFAKESCWDASMNKTFTFKIKYKSENTLIELKKTLGPALDPNLDLITVRISANYWTVHLQSSAGLAFGCPIPSPVRLGNVLGWFHFLVLSFSCDWHFNKRFITAIPMHLWGCKASLGGFCTVGILRALLSSVILVKQTIQSLHHNCSQ